MNKQFLRRFTIVAQTLLISGVLFVAQGLFPQSALAGQDQLFADIKGTGINGAFTLSSATGKGENASNPIRIPSNGEVSLTLDWGPLQDFVPTSCTGSTVSLIGPGNAQQFNGNVAGSGFFDPTMSIPLSGQGAILRGSLPAGGTSVRSITISCHDPNPTATYPGGNITWNQTFTLTFTGPAGVTEGPCTPATSILLGNTFVYNGPLIPGSLYACGTSNCSDVKVASFCSETDPKTDASGFDYPYAFCTVGCDKYNPSHSNKQSDGSFSMCSNTTSGTASHKQPLNFQFDTVISGPGNAVIPTTVPTGQVVNFNVMRLFGGESSGWMTTWMCHFSTLCANYHTSFTFGSSFINVTDSDGIREDRNAESAFQDAGTSAGLSTRAGSNCRAVAQRSITDSGSVSNEIYGYFNQSYTRNNQPMGGLWSNDQMNALYPMIQVEPVTSSVSVSTGTEGVDYVTSNNTVDDNNALSNITFFNPGTYIVSVKENSFSSALMICNLNARDTDGNSPNAFQPAPYNCGANKTRIQQFRGTQFPSYVRNYTIVVTGNPTPDLNFKVNGITADRTNPNRTSIATVGGSTQDPVTASIDASWNGTNLASAGCAVTATKPTALVTLTSDPWKSNQTGLATVNSSAPIGFGNILPGATSLTTLTLTCKTATGTVSRSVALTLSRQSNASGPSVTFTVNGNAATDTQPVITLSNPVIFTDPGAGAVSYTLPASWKSSGSASCAVQKASATGGVTITTDPWKSLQSNLPTVNASAPVTFGNLSVGTSTDVQLALQCFDAGGKASSRAVNFTLQRAVSGSSRLSFATTDQRTGGATVTANDATPDSTATINPTYSIGQAIAFKTAWVGDNSVIDNSCTVSPLTADTTVTVSPAAPWQGASNQPRTYSTVVTVNGITAPNASTTINLSIACNSSVGTLTRTVHLKLARSNASNYNITGKVLNSDGTVPVVHTMNLLNASGTIIDSQSTSASSGGYAFANVPNGTYSVTLTPQGTETCQPVSCSEPAIVSNADKTGVDFTIVLSGGSGATLNYGTGSQQWSR